MLWSVAPKKRPRPRRGGAWRGCLLACTCCGDTPVELGCFRLSAFDWAFCRERRAVYEVENRWG